MQSAYVMRLSREELERRRLAAAKDLLAGVKQIEVARRYHTTRASVSRWNKTLRKSGLDELRRKKPKGRASYLSPAQWAQVGEMLREGPIAHGFKNDLWTGPRVRRLIREKFGVQFHEKYVVEILRTRFNLSWQNPHRVARERDEAKRKEWIETKWTEIKKGRSKGAGR